MPRVDWILWPSVQPWSLQNHTKHSQNCWLVFSENTSIRSNAYSFSKSKVSYRLLRIHFALYIVVIFAVFTWIQIPIDALKDILFDLIFFNSLPQQCSFKNCFLPLFSLFFKYRYIYKSSITARTLLGALL